VHTKTRSDMIVKLFSEKVSPEVHDVAAKKEGFGVWKGEFMHIRFVKQEDRRQEMEEEYARRRDAHTTARSDMIIKLFSEKISPQVHDVAGRKEGFGIWKEEFLHDAYLQGEAKLKSGHDDELKRLDEESRRRRQEDAKEREVHTKTRSDMIVKMFSEKISPGVHDIAAKKEAFGVWQEEFMHRSYKIREENLRLEAEKENARRHESHAATRSDMIVKLFSEKISPGVHDIAAKKEAFGVWQEDFVHDRYLKHESKLREVMKGNHEDELRKLDEELRRKRQEDAKEREVHMKTRKDMIVKLFSEKISPGVHDAAAQKESFGLWKEDFMHVDYLKREEDLRIAMQTEDARRRDAHTKSRRDIIVKYFAERVSPAANCFAAKKEVFYVRTK
jgi:hypothetical protein